jgi:hypothetical protein
MLPTISKAPGPSECRAGQKRHDLSTLAGRGGSQIRSGDRVQQRLRLLQIARVKPFGEPAVNRNKQFARLPHLVLVVPEVREARCGAEFPLVLTRTAIRRRRRSCFMTFETDSEGKEYEIECARPERNSHPYTGTL